MNTQDSQTWLSAFCTFLDARLPQQLPVTAELFLLCGLGITVGLLLCFASVRLSRPLVTLCGFLVGGATGVAFAADMGVSQPLAGAVGGVIAGWGAFRTYKLWLLLATVVVVVGTVLVVQMDQASLDHLLEWSTTASGSAVVAGSASDQPDVHLISDEYRQQLTAKWERLRDYCAGLGVRGSILPIVAAVLAVVVAIRAARGLAALWLSLAGAILASASGVTMVVAKWPQTRDSILDYPQWVLGGLAALWLVGLAAQTRQLIRRRAPVVAPESAGKKS